MGGEEAIPANQGACRSVTMKDPSLSLFPPNLAHLVLQELQVHQEWAVWEVLEQGQNV